MMFDFVVINIVTSNDANYMLFFRIITNHNVENIREFKIDIIIVFVSKFI